jgi:hypothetical protein
VTTPDEAIRTFLALGMDMLAIGGHVCDADWRARAGEGTGGA